MKPTANPADMLPVNGIPKLDIVNTVVTPSGNSGHVVVPKAWIGKEAIVILKETQSKDKVKK